MRLGRAEDPALYSGWDRSRSLRKTVENFLGGVDRGVRSKKVCERPFSTRQEFFTRNCRCAPHSGILVTPMAKKYNGFSASAKGRCASFKKICVRDCYEFVSTQVISNLDFFPGR